MLKESVWFLWVRNYRNSFYQCQLKWAFESERRCSLFTLKRHVRCILWVYQRLLFGKCEYNVCIYAHASVCVCVCVYPMFSAMVLRPPNKGIQSIPRGDSGYLAWVNLVPLANSSLTLIRKHPFHGWCPGSHHQFATRHSFFLLQIWGNNSNIWTLMSFASMIQGQLVMGWVHRDDVQRRSRHPKSSE